MHKYRLPVYMLLAVLSVSLSGCLQINTIFNSDTSSSSSTSTSIIDLSIAGYNDQAIIAINTNTNTSGSGESIGTKPNMNSPEKQVSEFQEPVLQHLHDLPEKFRYSEAPVSKKVNLQSVESLTHTDTTATFFGFTFPSEDIVTFSATLKYGSSDSHCLIYAQDGIGDTLVNASDGSDIAIDWNQAGSDFDNYIYARQTVKFGSPYDVDGNGKTIVVVYDFYDGTLPSGGYVAGYFFQHDLLSSSPYYTNQKDLVNMNVINASYERFLETLAHEYQHLINYSQRNILGKSSFDTWIEEGFAESATHYTFDTPISSHISLMKQASPIRNGQVGLVSWDNTAYDYTLAYTFLQYARLQSTSNWDFFVDLLAKTETDYRAVEDLITNEVAEFTEFNDIVKGYHVANVVNIEDSIYGYRADIASFNFSSLSAPNTTSISLKPGGAVNYYPNTSDTNSFVPSNSGSHITFVRINNQ